MSSAVLHLLSNDYGCFINQMSKISWCRVAADLVPHEISIGGYRYLLTHDVRDRLQLLWACLGLRLEAGAYLRQGCAEGLPRAKAR